MKRAWPGAKAPVEWTEQELLNAMIRRSPSAWREFLRRFDGPLRGVVFRATKRFYPVLRCDSREEIMADFYLRIVENDMRRLRVFDWSKGSGLRAWLSRIAFQCATDHVRQCLATPRSESIDAALDVPDEGGVLMSGRKPKREGARRATSARK